MKNPDLILKVIVLVLMTNSSAFAISGMFCKKSGGGAPTPAGTLWANIDAHCHERGQTHDPQGARGLAQRRSDDAAVRAHTSAAPSATVTDTERARNANARVGERHLRAARRCHESMKRFKTECPEICNRNGTNCRPSESVLGKALAKAEEARKRQDAEAARHLQNANVTDASSLPDATSLGGLRIIRVRTWDAALVAVEETAPLDTYFEMVMRHSRRVWLTNTGSDMAMKFFIGIRKVERLGLDIGTRTPIMMQSTSSDLFTANRVRPCETLV